MDSIYAVPVLEKWLVYAPLHHTAALLNTAALNQLQKGFQPSSSAALRSFNDALRRPQVAEPRPPQGPPQPEFLGLITTRSCNLACRYCDFGASNAGPEQMDLPMAVALVDWMVEDVRRRGQAFVDVHFFGGEPFCAPEVVETAVHRTRAQAAQAGLGPRFEVATNGFFNEDRCRFVGEYFHTVILSFDGPEEIHDRHRPTRKGTGSYNVVARNAKLLGESPAKFCLRLCVTQESVGRLPDIARWCCESFRPDALVFEPLTPTAESRAYGLEPPDPWEFARQFLGAAAEASRFRVEPVYASASLDSVRHSFCPVGRDSLLVSPEGRISSCYLLESEWTKRGLDLNIGQVQEGRITLHQESVERVRALTAEPSSRCRGCLARWHCAGGCRVAHAYPGCPAIYDDLCLQTRIIITCRLLDDLGCRQVAQELLADRPALERLAYHPVDTWQH